MLIAPQILWSSTWDTLYMVFIASILSIASGLGVGLLLYISARESIWPHKNFYRLLSLSVNIGRSIPFVILMIALIPITRFIIGTSIGTNASIIPLAVAALPFYARIAETAFRQVAPGLLEAAKAMGLTPWQTIIKVVVPESKVALLEGATLTIIALIAYSSIVGMIGGGGLGDVAIRYGYQRFDVGMMLATIVILVLLVQAVQWLGDFSAKKRTVLWWGLVALLLLLATGAQSFNVHQTNNSQRITVGIVGGPMEQIMQVAEEVAAKDYGVVLNIVVFDDYVLPNQALNNGDIDANIFQHQPYLDAQIKAHGYKISALAKTFVYPLGFYSTTLTTIKQLPTGALVAIPNDPSNEGRALALLQKNGLITLNASAGLFATPKDILTNPEHLQFKELDAADIPRALPDVSIGALTDDYVSVAHFTVNQALLREGADVPYANIIAVQTARLHDPKLQVLVAIMHSKEVVKETELLFPDGAAIPAWKHDP
jgi:D-methionine transport system substrate-binding protein